jgi:hypothetical protein
MHLEVRGDAEYALDEVLTLENLRVSMVVN